MKSEDLILGELYCFPDMTIDYSFINYHKCLFLYLGIMKNNTMGFIRYKFYSLTDKKIYYIHHMGLQKFHSIKECEKEKQIELQLQKEILKGKSVNILFVEEPLYGK